MRRLSVQLLQAQDEERRTVARELDEAVSKELAALAIRLGVVKQSARSLKPEARKALAECLSLLPSCARELRAVSYRLHPPLLEELGFAAAVRMYTQVFTERSGVHVDLKLSAKLRALPDDVALILYRVIQESLASIHRPSGSRLATIQLARTPHAVELTVRSGKQARRGATRGFGILAARERVRQLGSRLEIRSEKEGRRSRLSFRSEVAVSRGPSSGRDAIFFELVRTH